MAVRKTVHARIAILPAEQFRNPRPHTSVGLTLTIYQGGRVAAQVRQNKESLGQARIEVDVTRDQVRAAWHAQHGREVLGSSAR